MSDANAEGDHKAQEVQVLYERKQHDSKEPFTVPEQRIVYGPATADVSSGLSVSGKSHKMSDAKANDAPRHVPSLAYWAEHAQEELEKGRNLNIKGLHTVVCIDLSESMNHGAARKQAERFFTDFMKGLKKVEDKVDDDFVALTVFGQEVKVVRQLTNNYVDLQEAFKSLKFGGPTPLYGGLLMALAGLASVSVGVVNGVKITSRVILVTDGHPTDPLLIAGSDVCDPDKKTKNQVTAMQAVQNISSRRIRIDCVPVGNADLKFLTLLATSAYGKVYSYKDGGKLARRTINSCHAGHVLKLWKMMKKLGSSLGTEISMEDVMDISEIDKIASLSQEEKKDVLEIAKESSKKASKKDDVFENLEHELEKYHYEFDDPAVQLPPLGTRVRCGPNWNRGREDDSGPGTIIGHHKNKRQVRVEWDKNGKSDVYNYGDQGKNDVIIVNEPRVLQSKEKIATGCRVRRGKDWKWGNQDGTPGTNGVVIKVKEDGWVWVRWPDKNKNIYRFDKDGKFDLEICPVESQIAGVSTQPGHLSTPASRHETDDVSFSNQDSSKTSEEGMVEQIEATSTASTVTVNTVVTSECTSSLVETPVMVASSQTSTNSLMTTETSVAITTVPATTLHESTSTPLITSTLLTSSASATASTPASAMTGSGSINITIQDTTNEDNLDVNVPVSRVPNKSHWKQLSQKELVEAQKENTPGIHTVICVDISASMRKRPAWEQTQQFFNDFINGLLKIKEEFDVNEDQVALSVFGHEVKVVQRLSKNYTRLQQAFSALKLGGPTPMYGGLQMALAGFANPVKLGDSKHRGMPMDFEEIAGKLKHGSLTSEHSGMLKDLVELRSKLLHRCLTSDYSGMLKDLEEYRTGNNQPVRNEETGFTNFLVENNLPLAVDDNTGLVFDKMFTGKLKHGSLTSEHSGMLKDLEDVVKIAARQASLFSEMLVDLGVASLSVPVVNGIKITPRIILITDGHLTDNLLATGPDVRDSDAKAKTAVFKAVKDFAEKKICIHCVPVGDADVQFLKLVANKTGGQIISYKDGRNLARRTINILRAGHIIKQWKSMNEIGKSFGSEVSLEEVMDMPEAPQIASLSQEDKVQVLDTAKEAVKKGLVDEDKVSKRDKYHYEFDDPNVKLPPLGTRVCRGPDWDRGLQDGNGLGTITGHHKTKIQVHVEWDKDGKSDFYRYGDGKYDVKIVNEPRVLQSDELIATGCHVRRGRDWKWGNQGGKQDSVGVVIKVKDDDWVWVRWPNRSKNIYRYGADGCFDLEICDPSGNPVESQTEDVTTKLRQTSLQTELKKLVRKAIKKVVIDSDEFFECDDPDIKLPSLGSRVRRGPDWNRAQDDDDGPGTIIGHNKDKRQVHVEWDKNGLCDFYRYNDQNKHEVVVVHEPRVLQSNEQIATGCHVKRGADWKCGNQDGEPGATGVVMRVQKDGFVWVRWQNKSKNIYRFGHEGHYDLEICDPVESQTAGVATQPGQQSSPQLGPETAAVPLSGQTLNTEIIETVNENDEGLPPEILQMDEHGQKLFKKALEAGKVEVTNIRVMIVGQKGVGKTTLTQRIQGLEITETLPTKGINVHAGCCKIDPETKEWCAAKSEKLSSAEENLFYCIYNYLNTNREEMKISIQQEQQRFSIMNTQPLLLLTSNPGENQAVYGVNVIPTDLDNDCKIDDGDSMEERNIVLHQDKPESNQHICYKGQNVDTISDNSSETVRYSSSQSEFIKKFVEWVKSKKYIAKIFSKVTMLDFAGEFLFYTTHQIFISGHTLYLLVTDISKPLSEIVEGGTYSIDMNENKKGSIQDYVIYWMNSIFCHAQPSGGNLQLHGDTIQQEEDLKLGEEKVVESKPVLLVATHLDKFQVEERDNKTRAYFKTVEDALRDRPFIHLIGGTIAIGNFGSHFQSDIDKLKTQIFEMAQKQPYWKHQVPVMWLALEQKLLEEKVRKPIIGLAEIRELDTDYVASIEKTGELEVFLDFEHKLGNILYFRTEKLKSKAVLDPVWLIDALQILHSSDLSAIRSGQGVKQCSPETAKHFHEFKKTGRITQSLMEYLWSEKEDQRFRQNQEYLLGVMEEMDIIVQPLENEKGPEKYYWVPSMIQDSAPEKVMDPGASKITNVRTRTSTICFVSKTKFIHVGVFHRLVASCLSKWAPAKEEKKYQLYRGCCLFTVSDADDDCHELLLALNDFVIQATVIRLTYEAKEPESDICIGVREFIYTTLSDIASCICPNSEFDFYVKCDRSSIYTTEGLLKVSGKKETKCNCSKPAHPVKLQEEMKFWEHREGNLPTNVLPSTQEGDEVRFMRIAFLYTEVASKVLRRLLHYYVVQPGYTFEEFLKDNKDIISKRVNAKQYAVMFPNTGTSDRKEYDVSLTSFLLLNFVNIDTKYEPYIESVRAHKNKDYSHKGRGRMDTREYSNCWNKITGELIYLSEACEDPDFVDDIQEKIHEIEHRRLGNQ